MDVDIRGTYYLKYTEANATIGGDAGTLTDPVSIHY